MKKEKQIFPIILLSLTLLLLGFYLILSLGNFKFSSKNAVEELYQDSVIESERYRFYLSTDSTASVIGAVKAVKRYGFLWKVTEGEATDLYVGEQEAGTLFCFEDGDTTHCFIRWRITRREPGVDYYAFRTDTIQVNGKEVKLDRLSYFTVDAPIVKMAFDDQEVIFKQ